MAAASATVSAIPASTIDDWTIPCETQPEMVSKESRTKKASKPKQPAMDANGKEAALVVPSRVQEIYDKCDSSSRYAGAECVCNMRCTFNPTVYNNCESIRYFHGCTKKHGYAMLPSKFLIRVDGKPIEISFDMNHHNVCNHGTNTQINGCDSRAWPELLKRLTDDGNPFSFRITGYQSIYNESEKEVTRKVVIDFSKSETFAEDSVIYRFVHETFNDHTNDERTWMHRCAMNHAVTITRNGNMFAHAICL